MHGAEPYSMEDSVPLIAHMDDDIKIPNSGFWQTTFNLGNLLLGLGILSLPYALKESGWVGIGLLLIYAVVTNYTGRMIQRCIEQIPDARSFYDIAYSAYGTRGRTFFTWLINFDIYAFLVVLVIVEGDSLQELFPDVDHTMLVCLGVAAITPFVYLKDLSWLSYLSFLGVFSSVFLLAVVLIEGLRKQTGPGSVIDPAETEFINLDEMGLSLGLLMVCFAGHAILPNIYFSMRDPEDFPRALDLSYFVVTLSYGLMAAVGYMMYGKDTEDQITLNLPEDSGLTQAAIWLFVLNPASKFPVLLQPVALTIEDWYKEKRYPHRNIFFFVNRTLIVISAVILALTFDYFERAMSFIGSIFACTASIIFPAACYLKMFGKRMSGLERFLTRVTIAIGVISAIIGTLWATVFYK